MHYLYSPLFCTVDSNKKTQIAVFTQLLSVKYVNDHGAHMNHTFTYSQGISTASTIANLQTNQQIKKAITMEKPLQFYKDHTLLLESCPLIKFPTCIWWVDLHSNTCLCMRMTLICISPLKFHHSTSSCVTSGRANKTKTTSSITRTSSTKRSLFVL